MPFPVSRTTPFPVYRLQRSGQNITDTTHGAKLNINHISSFSNATLKRIRSLHDRKFREKERQFLVEGARAVDEAFKKGLKVSDVVVSQSFLSHQPDALASHNLPYVSLVDDRDFHELCTTASSAGIIAVAEMPNYQIKELFKGDQTLIVIANSLQDPGNLGTIVRTALAANATGVILTKGTVDPFNPKVVRAAAGALFAMPMLWDFTFTQAVDLLRDSGVQVIACDVSGTQTIFDAALDGPLALIVGNEGNGFSAGELEQVDNIISIPMNPKSESLNVAVSVGVVLFNVVNQRLKSQSAV